MHNVYGDDHSPLYVRIEQGHSGRLIAKIDLPNGNEQLCFLERGQDIRPGEEIEAMITGVLHPMRNGRRDKRRVTALMLRQVKDDDMLMGISGFVQANDRDTATSLAFESDGMIMTQATATATLDLHSRRPLSMGCARLTRVLTPGRTGAHYIRNGSNAFREGSDQLAGATNVWVSRSAVMARGRKPVAIEGLTRVEDLDVFNLLEGRPPMRRAA